eukprot:CAMPEP_0204447946 /NCGR_PEP_ID=MMETSP0470-20130426/97522_1 /ASSEMBLY_ACC=CAM_ASM_000385 /TAXON_ID=2969 /ORGANISM="Oxyrrhis marina" /LENGTH=33 /DNA_ID= /DNA_START= /DNA_END= /DNA_ORIENTATION=
MMETAIMPPVSSWSISTSFTGSITFMHLSLPHR